MKVVGGMLAGIVAGSILTRLYDRSPRARRAVNWIFTADTRPSPWPKLLRRLTRRYPD